MTLSRTIIAERAAIASEQPLATLAGYDVLRAGGNAFDAAVATGFTLAVTFHSAGGLGGDFFGMFYEAKSAKVHCLNGSGWSPSGLTPNLMRSVSPGGIPSIGPLTCVVPGFVAGISEMHRRFGTMDFEKLLSPSVNLSSKGFPAGEAFCKSIEGAFGQLPPDARRVFAPNGTPATPGEWIRQEALGKLISEIAISGPQAFYSDWPADSIASTLTSLGVRCEPGDFSDYRPEWVEPLKLDYEGMTVHEVPPNSMGATTLLILKLLADSELSKHGPLSRERIELTTEAALTAYARRDKMLGDPRFTDFDVDSFMKGGPAPTIPSSVIRSGDTTAFSIVDPEGNIASGIQSLFYQFGSRVFIPKCGIVLNNRASGFSTTGPNRVEPRKRPLHTLSAMILERDGQPRLAIGTSGGDHRPMQHALFVTNAVDYSMSAERNVAHPRFLWGGGKTLLIEDGYEVPQGRKYEIRRLPLPGRTGVCHAVEISDHFRKAVCDVRGDGIPAGF